MRSVLAFLLAGGVCVIASAARADILITVDKSAQRLTVSEDGQTLYNWPVSTGMTGRATPSGSFQAFRMEADHFSKEWDDAPMPYSIFFTKVGHAIHGTNHASKLGLPVSHGCVRLSVDHARTLFALVKKEGVLKTKVVLTGSEQVALKRHREQMLASKGKAAPAQQAKVESRPLDDSEIVTNSITPRQSRIAPPRDLDDRGVPQYQYGERPDPRSYGNAQTREEQEDPYDRSHYVERSHDDEQRYADRRFYEGSQYGSPNYSYGEREYRPYPQTMQPQYRAPEADGRSRYGIY